MTVDKKKSLLMHFVLCLFEFKPFTKAKAVLFVRLKGVPVSCEEHEENVLITSSVWSKEDAVRNCSLMQATVQSLFNEPCTASTESC